VAHLQRDVPNSDDGVYQPRSHYTFFLTVTSELNLPNTVEFVIQSGPLKQQVSWRKRVPASLEASTPSIGIPPHSVSQNGFLHPTLFRSVEARLCDLYP
jgi:hypothetical protein